MFTIETCQLAKTVGEHRRLFGDLALRMVPSELIAIVGESGIGKSTLLNVLAGLDEPDACEVLIEGGALGTLDEGRRTRLRRERIGLVFQAFYILPYMTFEQNVALPLAPISRNGAAAKSSARAMFGEVGLSDRGRDYARDLSGSELQRVAIARALVRRRRLSSPTSRPQPSSRDRQARPRPVREGDPHARCRSSGRNPFCRDGIGRGSGAEALGAGIGFAT